MPKISSLIFLTLVFMFYVGTSFAAPPPLPSGVPVGGPILFKGSAVFAVLMLGLWVIVNRDD